MLQSKHHPPKLKYHNQYLPKSFRSISGLTASIKAPLYLHYHSFVHDFRNNNTVLTKLTAEIWKQGKNSLSTLFKPFSFEQVSAPEMPTIIQSGSPGRAQQQTAHLQYP